MENYNEFLERISIFEKKNIQLGEGYFHVSNSVSMKLNEDNRFRPFYGDTVVFDLEQSVKDYLSRLVNRLYDTVPQCFSERINPDTFHLTLHDLSNSSHLKDIEYEMNDNKRKVLEISKEICFDSIMLKSNYIINMVNTSLVLCLVPSSHEDYNKLMELYSLFDQVVPLPYLFTPHITLAYYSYSGFDEESKRKLEGIVNELNEDCFEVKLKSENLWYQRFISMNEYYSVINLSK